MNDCFFDPSAQDVDDYIKKHNDRLIYLSADSPLYDGNISQIVRHNMRIRRIARLDLIDERRWK